MSTTRFMAPPSVRGREPTRWPNRLADQFGDQSGARPGQVGPDPRCPGLAPMCPLGSTPLDMPNRLAPYLGRSAAGLYRMAPQGAMKWIDMRMVSLGSGP